MSIHAYVKYGERKKQIPLAFAIMSRRSKEDYDVVFKAIIKAVKDETGKGNILEYFSIYNITVFITNGSTQILQSTLRMYIYINL